MYNPYKILEVNEKASLDEIIKSYKKLLIMYHPDKFNSNYDKFLLIKDAYRILSNNKYIYDQYGIYYNKNHKRLMIKN